MYSGEELAHVLPVVFLEEKCEEWITYGIAEVEDQVEGEVLVCGVRQQFVHTTDEDQPGEKYGYISANERNKHGDEYLRDPHLFHVLLNLDVFLVVCRFTRGGTHKEVLVSVHDEPLDGAVSEHMQTTDSDSEKKNVTVKYRDEYLVCFFLVIFVPVDETERDPDE